MRRQNYYRPNNNSRTDYRQAANNPTPNRGPVYNNYGPQRPYYPERPHHHVFMWIVIIILCLGLGWFAADHFLGGGEQSSGPQTTVNRSKTVNNNQNQNQGSNKQQTPQQPNADKLEREMNRLDVSAKDQQTAINFYQKQSPKNQAKMNKMIDTVNHVVPSDTLKKRALNWILR